jgi:hypothetical protein
MEETGTFDFSSADLMAVAPSCVAETVVNWPLNCFFIQHKMDVGKKEIVLTAPVGVRLALIIYASLISFLAGVDVLKCLCILARRCCGRDAAREQVRRTEADMIGAQKERVRFTEPCEGRPV